MMPLFCLQVVCWGESTFCLCSQPVKVWVQSSWMWQPSFTFTGW